MDSAKNVELCRKPREPLEFALKAAAAGTSPARRGVPRQTSPIKTLGVK
jgi:hypothetical protein